MNTLSVSKVIKVKKAKGLGLSAIETTDGIEIDIKDTNSKELAIKFLQANK